MRLQPGQTVDRYSVERVLGSGGTAMVYLVTHTKLGTKHALKMLTVSSEAIRQRLLREGQVQATLNHDNIVTVTDVLDLDGAPGLLMEYIEGPSLEDALGKYQLRMGDAETLFHGILAGVRVAHKEGWMHRDLKPANILLARTKQGFQPKVTDFGLAKVMEEAPGVAHTRSGIAMGTPSYMAPEQIRDARTVDYRADVWSLGCILYELVTRRRTFPGDEALAIYNSVSDGDFVYPRRLAPDLPPRVEQAIHGCLRVDREERIPDCDTLFKVLRGEREWPLPADLVGEPATAPITRGGSLNPEIPEMAIASPIAASAAGAQPGVEAAESPAFEQLEQGESTVLGKRAGVDGTLAPANNMVSQTDHGPPPVGMVDRLMWVVAVLFGLGVLFMMVLAAFGVVGSLFLQTQLSSDPQERPIENPVPSVEPDQVVTPEPEPEPEPAAQPEPAPEPVVEPAPDPEPRREPEPQPIEQPVPPPQPEAPPPLPAPAEPVVAPAPAPAQPVVVKVLTSPNLGEIRVNGSSLGRAPKRTTLPPGTHTIQVTSAAHGSRTFSLSLQEGDPVRVVCYVFEESRVVAGNCPPVD